MPNYGVLHANNKFVHKKQKETGGERHTSISRGRGEK